MKEIKVQIKQKGYLEYPIYIGETINLEKNEIVTKKMYSKILCIFDKKLDSFQLKKSVGSLQVEYLPLEVNDKGKTIEKVKLIWEKLYKKGFDRKSLILNIGGGVIGDIGGFAASTYMRGISFIQIPTTLLAQVDASIGGKTGVNFRGGKNIIGTFQQPSAVVIDINYLETLPKREFLSGFSEIIKHGIISGEKHFSQFTIKKPKQFSKQELINIIEQSCLIKKSIIEEDSTENGKRKILNLGHTIGHAIESLSHETKYPLLHGEAISIGLLAEAKISKKIGLLSEKDLQRIEKSLESTLVSLQQRTINRNKIENIIKKDKKNNNGKIKWTLIKSIGNVMWDQEVPQAIVSEVLKETLV